MGLHTLTLTAAAAAAAAALCLSHLRGIFFRGECSAFVRRAHIGSRWMRTHAHGPLAAVWTLGCCRVSRTHARAHDDDDGDYDDDTTPLVPTPSDDYDDPALRTRG